MPIYLCLRVDVPPEDSELAQALDAKNHVLHTVPHAAVDVTQVVDRDWTDSQKLLRKPMRVGRLTVVAPEERAPPDFIPVIIPKAGLYGRGENPSTWLMLEALDEFLAAHPGASALDIGTGTGVLAIAAKKLGSRSLNQGRRGWDASHASVCSNSRLPASVVR